MSPRNGAVHVATTTRHHNNQTYRTHLLRRTFRQDGKVKYRRLDRRWHDWQTVVDACRRVAVRVLDELVEGPP